MEATVSTSQSNNNVIPMAIVASLFFIFGFATWLNGSLMPFLEIICQLSGFQATLVLFSFYIAYVVMALPMSMIINRVGYKSGMVLGMALMALAALLYIPAAQSREFAMFLVAQFTMGAGLTVLQTASNPYVVKLGPESTAAVRICIMGILNKFAGVVAPVVFGLLIVMGDAGSYTDHTLSQAELDKLASQLVSPYVMMAVLLGVLAVALKFSPLPEIEQHHEESADDKSGVWHFPHLILGVAALFLYVGVEVIAGDTIGSYAKHLGLDNFTTFTKYTMIFMVLGYAIGMTAVLLKWLSQERALAASAVLGVILSLVIIYGSNESTTLSALLLVPFGGPALPDTITALAVLGFANAIVWPAIWPLALRGLGRYTSTGAALLIMGIAGGALLPLLLGALPSLEMFDRQSAYWVMVPGYLFILFYALKGHKLKAWK